MTTSRQQTRPFRLLALAGLIAVGAASCAPSPEDLLDPPVLGDGSVTATVLQATAAPGAIVDVRFVSTNSVDFGFSSCGRLVERRVGSSWQQLPPELRVCAAVVDPIRAGTTTTYRVDVPSDATPGTYRFVFAMLAAGPDGGGTRINVASEPFRVE